MSVGFRKSLFGYNQDDVIEYVKKLHNNFSLKEDAFKKQLADLESKINGLNQDLAVLENEKASLSEKLSEYNAKKSEMDRLSENIGKLYMVSQANAKTIMANAEENSKIANMEIEKNVSAIEETHKALEGLKQSINETSQNFTKEVESLMHSLEEAKEKFSADNIKNGEVSEEFTALLEVVSK